MNIRKADSKGRITGFEPGRYYEISTPDDRSTAVLRLLAQGGYVSGTVHEGEFHFPKGYEKGYD